MNSLLEVVNRFKVQCRACNHFYQTALVDGSWMLVHATVDPNRLDEAQLPTPQCRLSYDFVRFDPCNHCCPEVFAFCPETHVGAPGLPSKNNCSG